MKKLPKCLICKEKPASFSHYFGGRNARKEDVGGECKERAVFVSRMLGTYDEIEKFKRWYKEKRANGVAQNSL